MIEPLVFAIPSYKRAFEQLTLDYLAKLGVPRDMIVMSVQTQDDLEAYRAAGIEARVSKLIYRKGSCVGDNRNNLLDNIPEGTYVVMMDDDIKTLVRLDGKRLRPVDTYADFMRVIVRGFTAAAVNFSVGFGLYPTDNAYYMSNSITHRTVADGMFLGLVNTKMRYNASFKTKEDYELCCRIIREYGAFPRLNMYATRAKSRSRGGCEEFWADAEGRISTARRLVSMYPDLLTMNPRREGEVLMRRAARGATQ